LAGKGYYVVGVEQDQAAASVAAPFYDEFIVADVEAGLRLSGSLTSSCSPIFWSICASPERSWST
jgi:hypothetical protein